MATKRPRRYAGDGTRVIDEEENLRLQEARDKLAASAREGYIRLFCPTYPHLKFGPGSGRVMSDDLIVFGPEPHVALVKEDHPLLEALLKRHPNIEVIEDDKPITMLGCPYCDDKARTKELLAKHLADKHGLVAAAG